MRINTVPHPVRFIICTLIFAVIVCSCKKDSDEIYPSIIDEFATIATDSEGHLTTLILDNGQNFPLTNEITHIYVPDTAYRVVVGYVPDQGRATLYRLQPVVVLADSTSSVKHDPIKAVSLWQSGAYINLHLVALTQDIAPHYIGFAVDSACQGHTYLSVHHAQNNDPISYSSTLYCSINKEDVPGISSGDTLSVLINTFSGKRRWDFVLP